jgi:hypothetical protein
MAGDGNLTTQLWAQALEKTPGVLRVMLVGAPVEVFQWRSAPDRWSITDVFAHLLDMEVNALRFRARKILEEDNPFLPDIDQEGRAKGYSGRDPWTILEEFQQEREKSLQWLKQVPPEALPRTAQHEVIGELTLENHVNQWAFHDLGHIRQVAEIYRASLFYPHTGNYHKFYSVNP